MLHMATTIKEEPSLPGYPEDQVTTDLAVDDSLTSLDWLRKFSIPAGADPERNGVASCPSNPPSSPLAGDTPATRLPLHPLAGDKAATRLPPLHPGSAATSAKPHHSYASLIYRAIQSNKHSKMTLSNIYKWMADNFPYYRNSKNCTWQNSVRHTLSVNGCFVKVCREQDKGGKGGYWQVNPENAHMFVGGTFKGRTSGAFPPYAQKRKLLPQEHNSAVPNAVPNHNAAVQGHKQRRLLPQHHNTVPQGHNNVIHNTMEQQAHNTPVWRGGHNIVVQGHNIVLQQGYGPSVQICMPSVQIQISAHPGLYSN